MKNEQTIKFEITQENYIDHELRIRMIERVNKQLVNRMNGLITIAVTAVILPILLKHWGI